MRLLHGPCKRSALVLQPLPHPKPAKLFAGQAHTSIAKEGASLQGAQQGMANLFNVAQMGGDGGANDGGMSGGGLPLSEADGMPSLSGMSPSDAAAFLQSNKKVRSPHQPDPRPVIKPPERSLCTQFQSPVWPCSIPFLKEGLA